LEGSGSAGAALAGAFDEGGGEDAEARLDEGAEEADFLATGGA
jgi:hypothetical protein